MANALIEYDEEKLKIKDIEKFIKQAGYESLGLYNENEEKKSNKLKKINFIIFTCLSIILLYISMGHMLGIPTIEILDPHINPINYALTLFFISILYLIYGFEILKAGIMQLIHRTPNMDTLVAIGVLSSFLYSTFGMIMILEGNIEYVENLYFESAAIVIFFIKLGRYVESISKDKTKDAIKKLVQITPKGAIIKVDGKEKKVTIDEIQKGDTVVCYAGDKIAVDGVVNFGKSHLDESFITGESKPVTKGIGDKVIAGSLNYDGYLEYTAEKIGKDSTISQIVRLVIEATNTKAPIAKIADKISGYFVPILIIIAMLTFIAYLILGFEVSEALITFVTILVIACPCSLGLATPLAIVVSEGICANNGILVKKSEILENAEKIDTIIFDKTGTLTYGNLKISEILNFTERPNDEILRIVSSIEAKSTHPIAKAFVDYAKDKKIKLEEVENFENISGYGITGNIGESKIILGNAKIVAHFGIENNHKEKEEDLAKKGNSIIYVIENSNIIAIIGVNDILRENAKEIISKLKKHNKEVIMLTGDNNEVAQTIAKEVGIENVISNVLPSDKVEQIKDLKEAGKRVMMCGDGINDSPALANADIGVSIHSGTDIAMDSADVVLMKNDLNKILDLINISKKTVLNIKQNLFWAFFYNVLMIPIAMGVLKPIGISINPMIAGFAMIFSSFTVILNTLRLRKIKLERND